MPDLPKGVKRQLFALAGRAYDAELARELTTLSTRFDEWKAQAISARELEEAIHRFHNGPARELYGRYRGGDVPPEITVAYALTEGILQEDEVPDDLMPYLRNALGFYGYLARGDGPDEGDEDGA